MSRCILNGSSNRRGERVRGGDLPAEFFFSSHHRTTHTKTPSVYGNPVADRGNLRVFFSFSLSLSIFLSLLGEKHFSIFHSRCGLLKISSLETKNSIETIGPLLGGQLGEIQWSKRWVSGWLWFLFPRNKQFLRSYGQLEQKEREIDRDAGWIQQTYLQERDIIHCQN